MAAHVIHCFRLGFDTYEIAAAIGFSEAEVYNLIGRLRSAGRQ